MIQFRIANFPFICW